MTSTGVLENIDKKLDLLIHLVLNLEDMQEDQELSPEEKKVNLWLNSTANKCICSTYRIPEQYQLKLKQKLAEEGYSLQEGLARLIGAFVDGRISVKEENGQ